jgi:lambda family phage portal protein
MFDKLRRSLAALIAPKGTRVRMYASARPNRLSGGSLSNSSADQELTLSLTNLRNRSRQLVRDASYAKNAKRIILNNVIGTGIGLQSNVLGTRGEPNKAVNDAVEHCWEEWCRAENCHTGGALHFHDIERLLVGQVFEAGEIFVRYHPIKFGRSKVPLALEIVEPERIADEVSPSPRAPGNMVRLGIEVDEFYRAVRYFIRERHQGEFRLGISRSDNVHEVLAEYINHLRIIDRWPQGRGEPWMHTVVRKLQDIDGYSEAEIVAARGAANYFASIKLGDDPNSPVVETAADGTAEMQLEPGTILKTGPGEELVFHTPNRPNSAMDPFMRLMLREVAAGCGVSYESLARDYSQSNYSSSRLALLDDRDLWRFLQLWFIRSFREPLHRLWLQQATLAGAIPAINLEAYAKDQNRYCLARYKPRGWSWIDPTKEVSAFAHAVRSGFTDIGHVISQTAEGRDLEDVLDAREQELKLMKEKKLQFDTDPERKSDGSMLKEEKSEQQKGAFGKKPGDEDDESAAIEEEGKPKPKPAAPGRAVIPLGGRQ